MSNKEIKSLSEEMLKAFDSKSAQFGKHVVVEQTEAQKLQEQITLVNRKISSVRRGGFGDLKSLAEEKSRLEFALYEANVQAKKIVSDLKAGEPVGAIAAKGEDKDEVGAIARSHLAKKQMKKDVVEDITELHMSLLEASGIEAKVAAKVKQVFDSMSTEDKAAFMKSYLKNPKAAVDYMFKDMQKSVKEEVELGESIDKKYLNKAMDIINSRITKPGQKPTHPSYDKAPSDIKTAAEKLARNLMKEALDPVGKEDGDVDNDGDVDKSDKYLKNRRKAIAKALAKEEFELEEMKLSAVTKKLKDGEWEAMHDVKAGKPLEVRDTKTGKRKTIMVENTEAELEEGYTINHKTFSDAVQHAKAQVEKQGYTIDDDEWDRKVAMGPKKPGTGKTNRYTIALMKGGKETKRNLQMQVYYDEGRYELNMYVS